MLYGQNRVKHFIAEGLGQKIFWKQGKDSVTVYFKNAKTARYFLWQ